MIPRSTTLTDEGRRIRGRIVWGAGALAALSVFAFVFLALDRSTVVDGPAGTSYATTATGTAALFDTLDRSGRQPVRLRTPLSDTTLAGVDTYVVADVGFGRYEPLELAALDRFVRSGGTAIVLGVPPDQISTTWELDAEWTGAPTGVVPTILPEAPQADGTRFGSFSPGHGGTVIAGTDERHLVVSFDRDAGRVVLIADSSIAHNAAVARRDNVDVLGALIGDRPLFDEYRHGYSATDDAPGLVGSAPGNWGGALVVGGVALAVTLLAYGRRVGPVEPSRRTTVPERVEFIDSVARSMRRAGDPLPTEPLLAALADRAGSEAVERLGNSDKRDPWTLDAMLAEHSTGGRHDP